MAHAHPRVPVLHRRSLAFVTAFLTMAGVLVTIEASPAHAATGGIVISELNYHAGSDLDTDDFLELTNAGTTSVDMSGWSFTAGVSGTLPAGSVVAPGARFVVARDAAQFTATNGFAPDAVYGGDLKNSSEAVTLVDANLATVDTVTYADTAPWPTSPDGTGPTLELRDLAADNEQPENWGASLLNGGTPRAKNSVEGTTPAPATPTVTDLTATPARPAAGQAVVVSARLAAGSDASLTYKVTFGNDVAIPFRDDAASPGGAGDGVYAATIPAQSAGKLIRYRIEARVNGTSYSEPAEGDSAHYRGLVVRDPNVTSTIPIIEWFMDDAVYNDILANHREDDVQGDAVWAYDGQVIDGVLMNVRGNSSRTDPKVNWKVELPKGYTFDLGGKLPYALDEFALQNYSHNFTDVGWDTVKDAGARALNIIPVRTQRNGAFWGLTRIMETEDGEWRKDQGVEDWAIYKGDAGSVGRTSSPSALEASGWLDKKTREDEDFTDVWTLSNTVDASPSAAQRAWIYQNVNVPELINYMAINSIIRHQDSGYYNWWLARDTADTGRWEMWHWDLNWIFTTPSRDGKGEFLTPDTSNNFTQAMLAYPEFKEMFFRRLRTLADEFLPAGKYEAEWDAITAQTGADWNLDRAKWGGYTPSSARSAFLDGLADRRSVIANNTGSGKPVPASQSASASVVINEIQYNPGGTGGEFIELANPGSTAVDISGWTIDAIDLTVQAGTVIPAGGRVVFVENDTAFRSAYTGANRFVGGEYDGALSNGGETLELKQGSRVVDTVAFDDASPWPVAADGTGPSLELVSPTADNSVASNWRAASTTAGTPGLENTAGGADPGDGGGDPGDGGGTPPPAGTLAKDTFERTSSGGLGTAETGGAWTVAGTSSAYSVSDGAAKISVPGGSNRFAYLIGVSSTDTDLRATTWLTRPTSSSAYVGVIGRRVGTDSYGARAVVGSSGSVSLQLQRNTDTILRSASVPGLSYATGDKLAFRLQVTGTAPTTIQAKVWKAGTAEPAAWQAIVTDTTAALQQAGGIGLYSYLSRSAAPTPNTISFDDLSATGTGDGAGGGGTPEPPANVAPVAAFSSTTDKLAVNVTGAASSDADGSIRSYAWTFGDGGTAAGVTAGHTYASAGDYTVTLTVTDDAGATNRVSHTVTVADDVTPPPAGGTDLATDTFERTASGGLGSAETGGAWTVAGSASAYGVSDGAAKITAAGGSNRYAYLNAVSSADTDLRATAWFTRPVSSSVYVGVIGRQVGSDSYGARAVISSSGSVTLQLQRNTDTILRSASVPGLSYATGDKLAYRLQVTGTAPTTIQAKVWKAGTAEPAAWQATATDSTAALQKAGAIGLYTYLSRSAAPTNLISFDDLTATSTK
ncbi:lamin tail domain-containing protein [Cryobacterium tepidiphilum]|nr:lamin tail domain-containing protein [Cryobacterium tepidiphilum]